MKKSTKRLFAALLAAIVIILACLAWFLNNTPRSIIASLT